MDILKLLQTDVLAHYEKIGLPAEASIPEFLAVNQLKKQILKERHDTYFGMPWDEAIETIMLQGFNVIHEEKFIHDSKEESLLIFWDGACIIKLTSFHMTKKDVNSIDMYYNWYSKDEEGWKVRGSGSFIKEGVWDKTKGEVLKTPQEIQDDWFGKKTDEWLKNSNHGLIWSGNKDVHEGLLAILEVMRKGVFIVPWLNTSDLSLVHYGEKFDSKDYNKYNDYKTARLAKLPVEVRKALGRE